MVVRKRGAGQRARSKKPLRKGSARTIASRAKREDGKLPCCEACHSPHVELMVISGQERFVCHRCGQVSFDVLEKDRSQVKELHEHRRRHAHRAHKSRLEHRHRTFYGFLEAFHLRLWFKMVSTMLLGFGVVLLSSSEMLAGALLTVVGLVGFTASFRFFR